MKCPLLAEVHVGVLGGWAVLLAALGCGGDSGTFGEGFDSGTPDPVDSSSVPIDTLVMIEEQQPGVRLVGRFDRTDPTQPAFGWSGSGIIARFLGTGASLRIAGSPNFFTVVVDGLVAPQVLSVVGDVTQYPLASDLDPGIHEVEIWRRTEGNQGENRFLGLDVIGGELLAPPAHPDRRIEIYGDSITAGYGMDGAGPNCPYSSATENHYLTYVAIAARELGADLHTVAWSGIGMYRNYGSAAASEDAMPAVYARTLPTQPESSWDFTVWQPHAVVINLGTNDVSTKGDPGLPFQNAYLDFVRALRERYPSAFFVLAIGPMLEGGQFTAIKNHLQAVISTRASEGDSRMSYLQFPVQRGSDGYGCDYHPSAQTNAKMAPLLVAELKAQLGW